MSTLPAHTLFDYAGLAAELRDSAAVRARHRLINEQLLDVRPWTELEPGEIERRLRADPLAAAAAYELTAAASYVNKHTPTEGEFLRPFTRRDFLKHLVYLGLNHPPENLPELPRISVRLRSEPWDALLFIHSVLRWAVRFAHWHPGDRRDLTRINLQYPFAVAVLDEPATMADALLADALRQLGVRCVTLDPSVGERQLAEWLRDQLQLGKGRSRARQQQLDFREAGGTPNSLFVVRAMGGVDGYDVRGNIGEDLGLIIDIGDKEVTMASTAYLERHVVNVINERSELNAEVVGDALVLRWYDTRLGTEDIGRIIYEALKQQFTLGIISVNLLFDPIRIASLRASIFSYREERAKELKRRSEEQEPFVLCRSCASYGPHAFCIVSVDRPPCCHRSYDELAALAQFTPNAEQLTIERGICRDRVRGQYMGADKVARSFSEGEFERINLHSIHEHPHPTTALTQCIVWFLEELDILCVIGSDYAGRTPDGKTFESLLSRVIGQQNGLVGISEAYLLSPRFLASEGGLSRVGWMNSTLKERLQIKAEHIATEKDCVNLAGLKEYLAIWRH